VGVDEHGEEEAELSHTRTLKTENISDFVVEEFI